MDERLQALLDDIRRAETLSGRDLLRAQRRANWLGEFTAAQLAEFLTALLKIDFRPDGSLDVLLEPWLRAAVQSRKKWTPGPDTDREGALPVPALLAAEVYARLGKPSKSSHHLLALL